MPVICLHEHQTLILGWLCLSLTPIAAAKDDPFISKLTIDHAEIAPGRYDALQKLEGSLWGGFDFHKVVVAWDVERENGDISESEWGLFYRTPLYAFWDIDLGLKKEVKSSPARTWAVASLSGTAPYHFDITLDGMASNEGRWAAAITIEQEWLITQRWMLMPSIEGEFNAKEDERNELGKGLSSLSWAFLVGYELVREFTPYMGVRHVQHYQDTAKFIRHEGEPSSETLFVVGFEAWL